jgi:hypothetical protein
MRNSTFPPIDGRLLPWSLGQQWREAEIRRGRASRGSLVVDAVNGGDWASGHAEEGVGAGVTEEAGADHPSDSPTRSSSRPQAWLAPSIGRLQRRSNSRA